MIYTYLLSSEFWRNVGMLFLFSCVLGPILFICLLIVFGISCGGSDQSHHSKSDPGEGCAIAFFFCGVVPAVYLIYCSAVALLNEENWLGPKKEVFGKECKKALAMGVFAKEAPLLYNYYISLTEYEENKVRPGINAMRQELNEMTTAAGKKAVEVGIQRAEKELADVEARKRKIEEKATLIYFARYMENLRVNVDDRQLRGEVDQIQREAEIFIKKYKENFPVNEK